MIRLLTLFFLLSPKVFGVVHYEKLVDQVTSRFVKEMAREKKMRLFGYGGSMMDDVEKITLEFTTQQRLTIDQARMLFIEVANKYIAAINQCVELRPYLHNYPFTVDNLQMGIEFEDQTKHFVGNDHVAFMHYLPCKRKLFYNFYNTQENRLYKVREETYEEVLELVNQKKNL